MATPAHDKYYLKTLHDEIDLFDRKLAHMLKYDTFATDAERVASAGKLNAKRELLAKTARQLVSEGIEFKTADLPRSFRTDDTVVEPKAEAVAATEVPVFKPATAVRQFPSPFAGTVLDGKASIQAYKRERAKTALSQA
ncbi:MAG: hypothetical protein ACRYFU_17625 [Janthinobacterium lividum]